MHNVLVSSITTVEITSTFRFAFRQYLLPSVDINLIARLINSNEEYNRLKLIVLQIFKVKFQPHHKITCPEQQMLSLLLFCKLIGTNRAFIPLHVQGDSDSPMLYILADLDTFDLHDSLAVACNSGASIEKAL